MIFLKQNNSPKFQLEDIKSSAWDYFDVFILVTGDITATADHNTDLTFTNCALLSTCQGDINEFFKQNNSSKIETNSIKSSLRDYFPAFILVIGDITVTADNKFRCCIYKFCTIFKTFK